MRPSSTTGLCRSQCSPRDSRDARSNRLPDGRGSSTQDRLLIPVDEGHGVAGTGFGAIARDVVDQVVVELRLVHSSDYRVPVLGFGGPHFEQLLGDCFESLFVTILHSRKDLAVEFL